MADKKDLEQLFNLKATFPADEEKRAFFDAAHDNDIKKLSAILEKWPDAVTKWETSGDPVIVASFRFTTPETLAFLVEKGADINQFDKSNFWNPLAAAAHGGYAAAIKEMLRLGADVDAKNHYGQTALYWAAQKDKPECVDLLVLCGADVRQGYDGARNESIHEVIRAAAERREKFLAAGSSRATEADAPASQEDAKEDNVIHILKPFELKKHGSETAAGPEPQPVPKKSWIKRILRR